MGSVIVIVIVVVAALVVYMFMQNRKKIMASSWSGTVQSKTVKKNDEGPDGFYVTFLTDAGDTVKLLVKKGMYDEMNTGDNVVKNAGERYPTKA